MGHATIRYRVSIWGLVHRHRVDVWHDFTSKTRAERFAKAIARYLPLPWRDGFPESWVLVETFSRTDRSSICYASFDPGGVPVKYHVIPRGYYGAPDGAPSGWCGPSQ